jgi:hypothetical protein
LGDKENKYFVYSALAKYFLKKTHVLTKIEIGLKPLKRRVISLTPAINDRAIHMLRICCFVCFGFLITSVEKFKVAIKA